MSFQSPTMESAAAIINTQVKTITEYMKNNGLSEPTLAANASGDIESVLELQQARSALLDAVKQLEALALGPTDSIIWNTLTRKHDDMSLQVLSHFDIASAVPDEGEISYEELSKKTKVSQDKLRRLIRHSMTNFLFYEPRPGYIAHTASTKVMSKEPLVKAWVDHNLEEIALANTKVVESIEKYGDDASPDHSPFNIVMDIPKGQNCFDFYQTDGEGENKGWRQRRFGGAMKFMNVRGAFDPANALNSYDWAGLKEGTVVDIGGSIGHISIYLAQNYPQLNFIIQDFAGLEPQFNEICPAALKPRIKFQEHDFFTPQPVQGASVYFLKHILHDWPDELAIKILENIVQAMEPLSRIVIVEGVVPQSGSAPKVIEKLLTSADLQMMAILNARERTKQDWIDLMQKADKRLVITSITQPPGSVPSIIEVALQ